jgi:hypothetical protein|tara:strand:+ start:501 stop:833 length:333 start_codon:yes stop_codon:yes gene_type:complete
MVGKMRDDIHTIVSAMMHNNRGLDFTRIMTQENMFDASLIRSFLLQAFDEEEFEDEMLELSDDFIRGVLSGIVLSLMVKRTSGEPMGTPSNAELIDLYDSGIAYITENKV